MQFTNESYRVNFLENLCGQAWSLCLVDKTFYYASSGLRVMFTRQWCSGGVASKIQQFNSRCPVGFCA